MGQAHSTYLGEDRVVRNSDEVEVEKGEQCGQINSS